MAEEKGREGTGQDGASSRHCVFSQRRCRIRSCPCAARFEALRGSGRRHPSVCRSSQYVLLCCCTNLLWRRERSEDALEVIESALKLAPPPPTADPAIASANLGLSQARRFLQGLQRGEDPSSALSAAAREMEGEYAPMEEPSLAGQLAEGNAYSRQVTVYPSVWRSFGFKEGTLNKITLSRRFTLAKRFTSEAVQSASRQRFDHALRAISLARDAYLGAAPGDSVPEDGSTLSTVLQQLYSRTVTIGITSLAREHVDAASAASEKLLDLTSESNLARADALEHRGRLCAVSGEYDRAASFFLECLAVHAKLEEDNVTKAAATAAAASAPAAKAPQKRENHKTIEAEIASACVPHAFVGKGGG